jgi:hypothetical protein
MCCMIIVQEAVVTLPLNTEAMSSNISPFPFRVFFKTLLIIYF